jgi:transcriptional regulator with XRE-family HTH domain
MKKRAQQILIRHKVRRAQLARDLGITASALWQWQTVLEKRERSPSFKVVERIMEITDGEVTANDFIRQTEAAQ